ncbi:hypothetical protein ACHAXN_011078 [Cyclotella atomus]
MASKMQRILLPAVLLVSRSSSIHAFISPMHHTPLQRAPILTKQFDTTRLLSPTNQEPITTFVLPSLLSSIDTKSLIESSSNVLTSLFQSSGNVGLLPSFLLNSILFFLLRSKLVTMLTPEGIAHSLALGTMLWTTLGWRGWTICVLYLFLGQTVTKVGFQQKEEMGIAEKRGGRRGPENVWGSAFTGVICAAAAASVTRSGNTSFWGLSFDAWVLGYVASLATKLADTFASEIGKAYGKTTFLITTLERVPRGTEGAISLEGTLASVVGGLLLPMYAYGAVGLIRGLDGVAVATFAAFVATMVESLIGATMQDKEGMGWMTNEVVNFFNTVIGATLAIGLGSVILRI